MKEQLSVVSGKLSEEELPSLSNERWPSSPPVLGGVAAASADGVVSEAGVVRVAGGASDAPQAGSGPYELPASRKIYIESKGLHIPFREIALSPSKAMDGTLEENAPVRVYDTSGPWTDPTQNHDVRDGLPGHRIEWITARGDVEEYTGREIVPQDNGYLTKGAEEYAMERQLLAGDSDAVGMTAFRNKRAPLRARSGACVTQMHYARKGIVTPEMEYVAIRENLGRQIAFQTLQESAGSTTPASQSLGHPSLDKEGSQRNSPPALGGVPVFWAGWWE